MEDMAVMTRSPSVSRLYGLTLLGSSNMCPLYVTVLPEGEFPGNASPQNGPVLEPQAQHLIIIRYSTINVCGLFSVDSFHKFWLAHSGLVLHLPLFKNQISFGFVQCENSSLVSLIRPRKWQQLRMNGAQVYQGGWWVGK